MDPLGIPASEEVSIKVSPIWELNKACQAKASEVFPQLICVTRPQHRDCCSCLWDQSPHYCSASLCFWTWHTHTHTQHTHPRLAFLEMTNFMISLWFLSNFICHDIWYRLRHGNLRLKTWLIINICFWMQNRLTRCQILLRSLVFENRIVLKMLIWLKKEKFTA